jgi:putative DNA primase/helicase
MIGDLRGMARALGGEVVGGQVLCPGPGRAPTDRSLRVLVSAASPVGFIAHSLVGDDFMLCRDHVAGRLAASIEFPK